MFDLKNKKIITTVIILLSWICAHAQLTQDALPRDVGLKERIDDVLYRFIYRVSFCEDTVGKTRYFDNEALEIGHQYIRWYSLFAEDMDSVAWRHKTGISESMGDGFRATENLQPMETGQYEEIFRKLRDSRDITVFNRFYGKTYVYNEPEPDFRWNFSDAIDTVLGYLCHVSRVHFRGREWLAWFTYDIPLPYGPWKLGGLPGLIVKAESADSLFTYELIGIQRPKDAAMYRYDIHAIRCKRSDILQLNDMRWKDPAGNAKLMGQTMADFALVRNPVTGKMEKVPLNHVSQNLYFPQRELE